MADVRMTAPNGAKVRVAADRVDNLVRHGFTRVKAAAKKAAPSDEKSSE